MELEVDIPGSGRMLRLYQIPIFPDLPAGETYLPPPILLATTPQDHRFAVEHRCRRFLRRRVDRAVDLGWQAALILTYFLIMNILIENTDTLEYLTTAGDWSKNPSEARKFLNMTSAYTTAKNEPIGRFNIVRHFKDTNQFVNLNHGRGKGAVSATVL